MDSNDLSFALAALGAVRQSFERGNPIVLQPIMTVEVHVPEEYLVRSETAVGAMWDDVPQLGLREGDHCNVELFGTLVSWILNPSCFLCQPQGSVIGGINKRRGTVLDSESRDGYTTIRSQVRAFLLPGGWRRECGSLCLPLPGSR